MIAMTRIAFLWAALATIAAFGTVPASAAEAIEPAPSVEPIETQSGNYKCCDGTRSPTCECGGPKRGCCSHHGGVCGC